MSASLVRGCHFIVLPFIFLSPGHLIKLVNALIGQPNGSVKVTKYVETCEQSLDWRSVRYHTAVTFLLATLHFLTSRVSTFLLSTQYTYRSIYSKWMPRVDWCNGSMKRLSWHLRLAFTRARAVTGDNASCHADQCARKATQLVLSFPLIDWSCARLGRITSLFISLSVSFIS